MSNADRKFYVSLLSFVCLYLFSCATALVAMGLEPPPILWAGVANFAGALMALLPAFGPQQADGRPQTVEESSRAIEGGKGVSQTSSNSKGIGQ